jgi:hypothetical protein
MSIREWDLSPEEFLVEFRDSRKVEEEMVRKLHSDLKC